MLFVSVFNFSFIQGFRRMANMKDIAAYAHVSLATVSRVLSGNTNVSLEKRKRVMEWVQKMDYQPNASARGLASSHSYLIGVMLPDISNPFFAEILSQIEEEATHRGYSLILNNTRGDRKKIRETINAYKARQVDGVLLCIDPREQALMQYVLQKGIPAVSFTQNSSLIDSVFISMEKGGALVARHLLDLGHERIGYIGEIRDPKFLGFREYLGQHGVQIPDERIIAISDWENLANEVLVSKIREFLGRHGKSITAIFAFNDIAAIQVLHTLQGEGFRVPEDIALAGFDNIFIAREINPPLTTVAQPTLEIGRLSVEILLKRIDREDEEPVQTFMLEPRLVVRESTRGA
jgi:LacI family transcriptional regulator